MVHISKKLEYVTLDPNFKPGPKNGHLSEKDPGYAAVEEATLAALNPMWGDDIPMDKFKEAWATAPPAIPENCPVPGKDVLLSRTRVPVRDGTTVEIKVYRSPKVEPDAALVLRTHGGGWTVGTHEMEEAENRYFGALPNVVVVSVDYRMAPEYPFPYPNNDAWDVLKWCKKNADSLGINPEKIIVAGSSGGGNMAVSLATRAKNEGITGIVGMNLAFPVTCHPKFISQVPNKENYELLSYIQNHNAGVVDSYRMEFFWDCYVGKDPKPDPEHSPLLHKLEDLKGLPPAIIQVSGIDPLRDEGIAFAEALKAAGVEVELTAYKGLPHCFTMFTGFKQTAEYYERVIAFTKKCAGAGSKETKSKL